MVPRCCVCSGVNPDATRAAKASFTSAVQSAMLDGGWVVMMWLGGPFALLGFGFKTLKLRGPGEGSDY